MAVLPQRELNRALLARQWLLKRQKASPLAAVEHLVGLQAQGPNLAYVALWTRLTKFAHDDLSQLIVDRKVVRIALMRSTIHLVTAADCLAVRPILQTTMIRAMMGPHGKRLKGVDFEHVAAAGRKAVEHKPLTFAELGALLERQFPGNAPEPLGQVVRAYVPLVQVPPRGLWGVGGAVAHTSAEKWLGKAKAPPLSLESLLLRYLAAFGPASVMDMQKWSGLTRLAGVVETLRPQLLSFEDESGRELFDLPDAPRPKGDVAAPPRFLPEYDNVLLGHADRTRIVSEEDRKKFFFSSNGVIPGAVLIDGFVRVAWHIKRKKDAATLHLLPMKKLSKPETTALLEEAESFLAFVADQATTRSIELHQ